MSASTIWAWAFRIPRLRRIFRILLPGSLWRAEAYSIYRPFSISLHNFEQNFGHNSGHHILGRKMWSLWLLIGCRSVGNVAVGFGTHMVFTSFLEHGRGNLHIWSFLRDRTVLPFPLLERAIFPFLYLPRGRKVAKLDIRSSFRLSKAIHMLCWTYQKPGRTSFVPSIAILRYPPRAKTFPQYSWECGLDLRHSSAISIFSSCYRYSRLTVGQWKDIIKCER